MTDIVKNQQQNTYLRPKPNAELANVVIEGKKYKIYFGNIINPFNPRVSWKENEPWNCNDKDESWKLPENILNQLITQYFDLHFWSEVQIKEHNVSLESAIITYLTCFLKGSIPSWWSKGWELKAYDIIKKYDKYEYKPNPFNIVMESGFNITKLIREKNKNI